MLSIVFILSLEVRMIVPLPSHLREMGWFFTYKFFNLRRRGQRFSRRVKMKIGWMQTLIAMGAGDHTEE